MSAISSLLGHLPGMATEIEEFQSAYTWGPASTQLYTPAWIAAGTVDSGNTPTTTLRMGLVLGKNSSGQWTNYLATATDGSQIASGVLPVGLRMSNVQTGSTEQKFWGVLVAGNLKGANLINLDNYARQHMRDRFIFDDDLPGRGWFPWKNFVTKLSTASPYQVLATDNLTLFDTTGTVGAVTFTLPALANGYLFGFRNAANQNMIVQSLAGNDMQAFNDLTASSVAFQTGGNLIGGVVWVYSNPAGTAWIVENHSAGANTITVA